MAMNGNANGNYGNNNCHAWQIILAWQIAINGNDKLP